MGKRLFFSIIRPFRLKAAGDDGGKFWRLFDVCSHPIDLTQRNILENMAICYITPILHKLNLVSGLKYLSLISVYSVILRVLLHIVYEYGHFVKCMLFLLLYICNKH